MTTTTPPGILTGKPALPGCGITVPGLYHNWPCTAAASHTEWISADGTHDGDLTFAESQPTGPMRIHYRTAAELRAIAAEAIALAAWKEATA